ncbi:MAG: hypothetical protein KatS3mg095_0041 [Candidatus Parcubacteria bacterium]|nr:MAG: hypothetical protein KatS3mg095_0041 [Candidatus Parcubacteria bacterium]
MNKKNFNIFIVFLIFLFSLIFINFLYVKAQSLEFIPQKIACVPYDIIQVLRGNPIPPGLLGRCLLFFSLRILTLIYTISLLTSVGFIIYSGFIFSTKPNDENARKYLIWAVIGVVITILAFSIVKAIEFSLTR